jgi:exodeoxyribonuclease V alpha subunit
VWLKLFEDKKMVIGVVKAIFFQNPSNFYKVILIKVTDSNTDYKEKELVITGSFGQIQEEESYRFYGEFTDHPRYGKQFQAETYEQDRPTSAQGVINYLSSDKFKGIGKRTAQTIVETLGEGAIDDIIENPAILEKVPGLNPAKQAVILETIRLNHGMEKVIVGLNKYGFGSQLAFSIYQAYENEALDKIRENPYRLVEEIDGVGFKKADTLAEQLGIEATSPERIRAAVMHEIFQVSVQTGDTYAEAENLLEAAIKVLETSRPVEISPNQVAEVIIELVETGKIQREETKLYDNSLYFSEWGIASSIQRLLSRKKTIKYSAKAIKRTVALLEKRLNISYGASQEQALAEAITSPLFILTGGPGTGKTTIVNGIVSLFAELNGLELDPAKYTNEIFPILLAAPTGRAAKRMNETTGLPASTIHRLLGLNGGNSNATLSTKELEGGLLIVDELSMVDTWLANTLFKAIPTNMQVILVGDKDQLPSVGPGQVLADLLKTKEIPQLELTEIYRQGDGSSIIPLAHAIKEGRLPEDFAKNQVDRSYFRCDAYQIPQVVEKIVEKAKLKGFTAQDIQVLAPMYRGEAGIDRLNKLMQEIFNPNDGSKKEVKFMETVYRINDKVLQLVNVPESNVYNGDMGMIVGIIPAKESDDKVDCLVIQFGENEVTYKRNEWNKITLAYCCSIHKSQGSEFKMVILPMVHQYNRMLQRNLLYTAITRSKELLILLGEERAFLNSVERESASRKTTLQQRIIEANSMSPKLRQQLSAYEESITEEDPFTDSKPKKIEKKESPKKNAKREETQADLFDLEEEVQIDLDKPLNVPAKSSVKQPVDNSSKKESSPAEPVKKSLGTVLTLENSRTIDPMIGMEGVTPADFM